MTYDIYVLEERNLSISGGRVLDGVTQGDGSHLVGQTITLNGPHWTPIHLGDDDADFGDNDGGQRLAGAQTIDGTTYASGSVVEGEYRLTLTDGAHEWTVVGFNVVNTNPAYASVEGLAFVGGPGGFPPTGVPLTVKAAQDYPSFQAASYATPICFASGTRIDTAEGPVPVEDIPVGLSLRTRDGGLMPVRWAARRTVPARGPFAPVVFAAGAVGNDRALRVSPQHRLRVGGWRAQLLAGEEAVLVPAVRFAEAGLARREEGGLVTYHHLMLDAHAILLSDGAETESFLPGPTGLRGLDAGPLAELMALFPGLRAGRWGPPALPIADRATAAALLAA